MQEKTIVGTRPSLRSVRVTAHPKPTSDVARLSVQYKMPGNVITARVTYGA